MKRICEICSSKNYAMFYSQKFFLPEKKLPFHYDVVCCRKCGFVFASHALSQKKLDKFYQKNIKYAYHAQKGNLPGYAQYLHRRSFLFIDSFLRKSYNNFDKSKFNILDVGCASGNLLNNFKKRGYKSLLGIDPAPECSFNAEKLYGLQVIPLSLSHYHTDLVFDLIIFASVLEHIGNLNEVLTKASLMLKDDGILFISVPDVENFGTLLTEPFLEFSLEHINYFTQRSLTNLVSKFGFSNLQFNSFAVELYGGYALDSLWRKTGTKKQIKHDMLGKRKITNYIQKSSKILEKVIAIINSLVKTQEKIIVWGAGSLTSRLLATTNLKSANIQAFVDSDPSLHGKKLNGISIVSPDILKSRKMSVFIVTYIHSQEIKQILLEKYHYKGNILFL